MKVYDIIIQPNTKLTSRLIDTIMTEITTYFSVKCYAYGDCVTFAAENLRISVEDIREDLVPKLLEHLDNIPWFSYQIANAFEVGDLLPSGAISF